MAIEVRNIRKNFGNFVALDDVSLKFPAGELTALLGPSGCGKTTLLRIIAGLERPDSGQVLLDGEDASAQHVRERQVGFVFQHYALFKHMSVFENIAFGLRVKPRAVRPPEAEIREKVMQLLALVQLDWLADRYPTQLSGGQRQRVALARALAVEPRVLLLDEPFGALDAKVRKELRRWLRRLHDELHVTSIFVTHDQEEAMEVADQVVLMNRGKVEQIGAPAEVYNHPASPFVYGFLGNVNLFRGPVHEGVLQFAGGSIEARNHAGAGDAQGVGYVRPHDIEIERFTTGAEGILVQLRRAHAIGPLAQLELEREDNAELIEAVMSSERFANLCLKEGETLVVRPKRLHVFVERALYVAARREPPDPRAGRRVGSRDIRAQWQAPDRIDGARQGHSAHRRTAAAGSGEFAAGRP
jgi:sulfate transport system ATP-binding protein